MIRVRASSMIYVRLYWRNCKYNSAMEHVFIIGNGIAVRLFCRIADIQSILTLAALKTTSLERTHSELTTVTGQWEMVSVDIGWPT